MSIINTVIFIYFVMCAIILLIKSCWGRAHRYSKISKLARRFMLPYDTVVSFIVTPFLIVDEIVKRL